MSKRALLIGCNYPGTQAELSGCVNDVWGTKNMLTSYYGFTEEEITVMIDTDQNYTQPTGANIKNKLKEMVAQAQDGDIVFIHFSGHGTQVPSDNGDEADRKDEAICPCDMNVISDDDLRTILWPLKDKPGVKLTFLADCCHSGSLLDHDEVVITGAKEGGPQQEEGVAGAMQEMLAGMGAGPAPEGNRSFTNRALPTNTLMSMLSGMAGGEVGGNIRAAMSQIFGGDASLKTRSFGNALAGLGGMGGFGEQLGGLLDSLAQPQEQPAYQPEPGGPAPGEKLPQEIGVLISGCQSNETSADAAPTPENPQPHGALSNVLHTVVKEHFEANPGQPLTNRALVTAVRSKLGQTGFAQNPCLECDFDVADRQFITL